MLSKFSAKLTKRHKSFIRTSVLVGALCLLFYVYLCVLQYSTFADSGYEKKIPPKPLTNTERVAECSQSDVCSLLAEVSYYEARGEKSDNALAAPMFVALNRLDNGEFGATLHSVVYAHKQFSYTHDGSMKRGIVDQRSYERALLVAHYVWQGEVQDPTNGAMYYHAKRVHPVWRKSLKKVVAIGNHIFYKKG